MHLKDSALFKQAALIGSEWVTAESTIQVRNPATDEVLGSVPRLTREDIIHAVRAATQAQITWGALNAKARSDLLRKFSQEMASSQEDLARIITLENGKSLADARGEVLNSIAVIEWFAEEARRLYGEVLPSPWSDRRMITLRQPVGVCAAITPWNFPNAMVARKLGPALAAGCAVVLKPASQTPFSALALAALARRAGLPDGVLNVVTGSAQEISEVFADSPDIRKISFTGSTEIGKELIRQSARTVKKVSMELGGNAPFIVFGDADIDKAVDGLVAAKFRHNGQTCISANRVFVQRSLYSEFAVKLAAKVSQMKVGNGLEPDTQVGPLIDARAVAKVLEHTRDAVTKGARVLTGGEHLGGNFISPVVIADVTTDMLVAREETFGPLAPLIAFDSDEQVLQWANDSEFGLAAYFYTRDLSRSWKFAERLEYGMVGVNTGRINTPEAPFGGIKQSGNGREGSHHAMDDYTEIKYVCIETE